jgi:hypothetical protein
MTWLFVAVVGNALLAAVCGYWYGRLTSWHEYKERLDILKRLEAGKDAVFDDGYQARLLRRRSELAADW